jgi:hypothetical protein
MSERLRRLTLPALVAIALFAIAAVAGYVTKDTATHKITPAEASTTQGIRGSVQSLNGNTLTLLTDGGPQQLTLASDATIEISRPTTAATITAGEWLNVGAIPNSQNLFAIIGLALIPQALQQSR